MRSRQVTARSPTGPLTVHVLVCDEHGLLAVALADHLRRGGHSVVVTSHPNGALQALLRTEHDVCLLGLRFGDDPLAGLDAISSIRRISPGTAVVLVGTALTEDVIRAALHAGARAAVDKGISLAVLDRLITDEARRTRRRPRTPESGRQQITKREEEVLSLLAEGRSNREIGEDLGISPHTVRSHLASARSKLSVRNQLQALVASTWAPEADA